MKVYNGTHAKNIKKVQVSCAVIPLLDMLFFPVLKISTHLNVAIFRYNYNTIRNANLQPWTKIMAKRQKTGVVLDTTSNVKLCLETIWSG